MVKLFKLRNYAIGAGLAKSEAILAAVLGVLFFSESLTTDSGEEVSTKEVKAILEELLESEDKHKPFSDDELTEQLQEKGYNIARRTVAKYREQLNVPVARLRKEL